MRNTFFFLLFLLASLNVGAQLSCDCGPEEVEVQVEFTRSLCGTEWDGLYYCDDSPFGSSWEVVNQNGTSIIAGSYFDNTSFCTNKNDILTVYGFDSDGQGWSGDDLVFKTKLGVSFFTFSPSGSFDSETFVPLIDGYVTPLSGACTYEIRDQFANTVWHSGYSGSCATQQCVIPAGQFELYTSSATSSTMRLEKIIGFPPNQGVIFEGTFNLPSPGFCNGCARSGLFPTCSCGEANVDGDSICDDEDPCVGELDECGVCGGNGVPVGFCDCDGNTNDAVGVCGGTCTADLDSDGICDDVDDCIGLFDECGICNGGGVQPGFCDCEGSVVDEVGTCGGSCVADVDDDGICDDVDNCIGIIDECGVCNGSGGQEECGCTPIPMGECDCQGNVVDAIGVCGGVCDSDLNGDGICDNAIGCTDPWACNYNSEADVDDGSCDLCTCYPEVPQVEMVFGMITLHRGQLSARVPEQWEDKPTLPPYDEALVMMDCNQGRCAGLTTDGRVLTWGNTTGAFALEMITDQPVKNILGVEGGFLILLENGEIITNGDVHHDVTDNLPSPSLASEIVEWKSAVEGVIARRSDGLVLSWGRLGGGVGANAPTTYYAEHIGIASQFCLAIEEDGTVHMWGNTGPTQVPPGNLLSNNDVAGIWLIGCCSGLVSYENGQYATWGSHWDDNYYNGNLTSLDPDWLNIVDVSAGSATAFVTADATVYALGSPQQIGYQLVEYFESNVIDECGVCGGEGAIYSCGCYEMPQEDCDCNGNQLDALGVCGGDCAADTNGNGICDDVECPSGDADQDGVCDDVDDCVGEIDICGVCNGLGATYQCGCDPLPDGACDCFGNILDECGVCGGDNSSCNSIDTCIDENAVVAPLGGCVNAIALLGCEALWDGTPLSEICPVSCESCPCPSDVNSNGICDDQEVLGCTYVDANNFNSSATLDDGTCIFTCYQLSDIQDSFDAGVASVECSGASDCPSDLDADGEVATSDLLIFLSAYATTCE